MKIQNQYHYEITDRYGTVEIAPLNESNFSISYDRETDGKYFYSKTFSGKIKFKGDIFFRLQTLEQSIYICSEISMRIWRKCHGGDLLIFEGFFTLTDGEWDLTRCTVEVKFKKSVLDKCLNDNKNVKINLLSEITNRITVKPAQAGGTIQYKNCMHNSTQVVNPDYWCGTGDPYAENWTLVSYSVNSPDGVRNNVTNRWARELIEVAAGTTPEPDWVLVTNPPTPTQNDVYAKQVMLYGCTIENIPNDPNDGSYSNSMNCQIVGYTGAGVTIDNGVLLEDVLNLFVSRFCEGKTLVSDFFQINPQNPSLVNYVTGLRSHTDEIVLFQKSDVKRPNVYNNASRAETSWEKLMEMLTTLFNTAYGIDGDVIRLEHFSWFARNEGLDLTLPRYAKWVKGKNRYTYEVGSIPFRENFVFKETSQPKGVIDYSNACAVGDKSSEKNYTLDEFMTDVQYALNNPDPDSSRVEDTGFVVVAARKTNGNYHIVSEYSPSGVALNNVLFFSQLLPNYHRHNRPLNKGKMNGVETQMLSTKPIKKGDSIVIPLCCEDIFNPLDTILTEMGEGIVSEAKYDLTKQTLELNLLYNVFDGLSNNLPPAIQSANYTMYANEVLFFPINASDVDGTVTAITAPIQPYHGTLEILSLTEGKYTPDPNFVGFDFFHLKATDNMSETSANAPFIINIKPANTPPVAQNDSYNVFHGQTFYASLGIFNNDTDDYGFSIVNPNITTALGINIVIDANGRFNYAPPAGYEGVDTFQYSIQDNAGLTSTATVTLNIAFKNKPIAVADSYQTQKDTQLITDGSVGKEALFANDYTPDGLTYSYTTNVENKATAAGGTVQIQANGLFTYTPPANFTGQDTFTYTVNNINGSAVGTVTINVLPTVYVKMLTSDTKTYGHAGFEYWRKTCDYTVYFYSDSAGTQPLNVTGFGLKVKIKEEWSYLSGTNSTAIWETNTVSGTSYKFYDDFVYFDRSDYGSLGYDVVVSIAAGAYVII